MVSDGERESQLLDGHNEGLPPTLAGGQGHAPVGEADRGRAGGTQKRFVGSSVFMDNQILLVPRDIILWLVREFITL